LAISSIRAHPLSFPFALPFAIPTAPVAAAREDKGLHGKEGVVVAVRVGGWGGRNSTAGELGLVGLLRGCRDGQLAPELGRQGRDRHAVVLAKDEQPGLGGDRIDVALLGTVYDNVHPQQARPKLGPEHQGPHGLLRDDLGRRDHRREILDAELG
jgi:hypothetical protein